ncbi:hypothetical protein CAOG_03049 [Capsaspora owczarzaki ATCC 30864]|uniref:Uncharacterized protein n=1 Tax=Capsaspora owczarzaki (strain ATCC 30864) TaxID=595528 RepID=A0A0D2VNS3_CAPO3|nr:hypothetical protein CAOG_03049 [Capsaspora owczarzaki ATCC 30864]KJE92012.1 hypothetical protein CAOG_003049 [Capsaspora owczarzaki ATCC 30864]|eukprot:XP_004363888.2 hypothetical protein CAOG_03049 [Capsaspora owczarzaki ATCC 30864]
MQEAAEANVERHGVPSPPPVVATNANNAATEDQPRPDAAAAAAAAALPPSEARSVPPSTLFSSFSVATRAVSGSSSGAGAGGGAGGGSHDKAAAGGAAGGRAMSPVSVSAAVPASAASSTHFTPAALKSMRFPPIVDILGYNRDTRKFLIRCEGWSNAQCIWVRRRNGPLKGQDAFVDSWRQRGSPSQLGVFPDLPPPPPRQALGTKRVQPRGAGAAGGKRIGSSSSSSSSSKPGMAYNSSGPASAHHGEQAHPGEHPADDFSDHGEFDDDDDDAVEDEDLMDDDAALVNTAEALGENKHHHHSAMELTGGVASSPSVAGSHPIIMTSRLISSGGGAKNENGTTSVAVSRHVAGPATRLDPRHAASHADQVTLSDEFYYYGEEDDLGSDDDIDDYDLDEQPDAGFRLDPDDPDWRRASMKRKKLMRRGGMGGRGGSWGAAATRTRHGGRPTNAGSISSAGASAATGPQDTPRGAASNVDSSESNEKAATTTPPSLPKLSISLKRSGARAVTAAGMNDPDSSLDPASSDVGDGSTGPVKSVAATTSRTSPSEAQSAAPASSSRTFKVAPTRSPTESASTVAAAKPPATGSPSTGGGAAAIPPGIAAIPTALPPGVAPFPGWPPYFPMPPPQSVGVPPPPAAAAAVAAAAGGATPGAVARPPFPMGYPPFPYPPFMPPMHSYTPEAMVPFITAIGQAIAGQRGAKRSAQESEADEQSEPAALLESPPRVIKKPRSAPSQAHVASQAPSPAHAGPLQELGFAAAVVHAFHAPTEATYVFIIPPEDLSKRIQHAVIAVNTLSAETDEDGQTVAEAEPTPTSSTDPQKPLAPTLPKDKVERQLFTYLSSPI